MGSSPSAPSSSTSTSTPVPSSASQTPSSVPSPTTESISVPFPVNSVRFLGGDKLSPWLQAKIRRVRHCVRALDYGAWGALSRSSFAAVTHHFVLLECDRLDVQKAPLLMELCMDDAVTSPDQPNAGVYCYDVLSSINLEKCLVGSTTTFVDVPENKTVESLLQHLQSSGYLDETKGGANRLIPKRFYAQVPTSSAYANCQTFVDDVMLNLVGQTKVSVKWLAFQSDALRLSMSASSASVSGSGGVVITGFALVYVLDRVFAAKMLSVSSNTQEYLNRLKERNFTSHALFDAEIRRAVIMLRGEPNEEVRREYLAEMARQHQEFVGYQANLHRHALNNSIDEVFNKKKYKLDIACVVPSCLGCWIEDAKHGVVAMSVQERDARIKGFVSGSGEVHSSVLLTAQQLIARERSERGARILVVDGGGIRGVALVKWLMELRRAIANKLRVSEARVNVLSYFDLVVGTSAGAILLLELLYGMGAEGMDLDRAYPFALEKMPQLFPEKSKWSKLNSVVFGEGVMFDATELEKELLRTLGTRLMTSRQWPLCMVTTMRDKEESVLTNAQGLGETLPGEGKHNFYAWLAARATSAAQFHFNAADTGESIFEDAGQIHNNPIALAVEEAVRLFPAGIECVVSLGTGYVPNAKEVHTKVGLVQMLLKSATNSHQAHLNYERAARGSGSDLRHYFRFDMKLDEAVGLGDASKLDAVVAAVDVELSKEETKDKIVRAVERLLR